MSNDLNSHKDVAPLKAISGATFSECGEYRYHLWRDLPLPTIPEVLSGCAVRAELQRECVAGRGTCLFIMLNPSTADHVTNDATVERCQRRAMSWGYDRLEVCNLFALRSTDPKALYSHPDPIGPRNDAMILRAVTGADLVICAWGKHGALHRRYEQVRTLLAVNRLHVLKLNDDGQPTHPLYLPFALEPTPWQ